jgi:hypothetical protein
LVYKQAGKKANLNVTGQELANRKITGKEKQKKKSEKRKMDEANSARAYFLGTITHIMK